MNILILDDSSLYVDRARHLLKRKNEVVLFSDVVNINKLNAFKFERLLNGVIHAKEIDSVLFSVENFHKYGSALSTLFFKRIVSACKKTDTTINVILPSMVFLINKSKDLVFTLPTPEYNKFCTSIELLSKYNLINYWYLDTYLSVSNNPSLNILNSFDSKVSLKNIHASDNYINPISIDSLIDKIFSNIKTNEEVNHYTIKKYIEEIEKWRSLTQSKKYSFNNNVPLVNETKNLNEGLFHQTVHQHNCSFELIYRMDPSHGLNRKSVADFRINLGRKIAQVIPRNLKSKIDMIVPVPETGKYYAQGMAEELRVRYCEAIIRNNKTERGIDIGNSDDRRSFISKKLMLIPELLKGKNICLVDESIFTGVTLKIVCSMLKNIGVKSIVIAIPTPECKNGCPFDMLPPRTLLSEYQRIDNLDVYFDVDFVYFLPEELFKIELAKVKPMCSHCFTDA